MASASLSTPQRTLGRSRGHQTPTTNGLNTSSTPNLGSRYKTHDNNYSPAPPVPPLPFNNLRSPASSAALRPKPSLNSLTSSSLATIPDATDKYALSTVLDEDIRSRSTMASRNEGDIEVGDVVDVPGGMYGTVKFIGSVQGKKGVFAGVELSEEFASRGKNNGDVDGISYFTTTMSNAGIFLPSSRATRRSSPPTSDSSFPLTPKTPSLSSFKLSTRNASNSTYTPPTPSIPKFSQSVGPGRAPSPQLKKRRPSLPRPESPIRRLQTATPGRTNTATPSAKTGMRYATPQPNKFAQSVRGTRDAGDPTKKLGLTPRTGLKSIGPRSASAIGEAPAGFSDDDTTPIGTARTTDTGAVGPMPSFSSQIRPNKAQEEEIGRLKAQLDDRDRQLKDQASSLAEMESSLGELQMLMSGVEAGNRNNRGSLDDKDVTQLRAMLREKNEKIASLTAEFDAHRADFRSTIDTLELASTETERVYEKRVEDLLQELREVHERTEDVESVAHQLKQLEELVQELEEGLEDARRGEAEARGEVEFLRGEVERGRAELRREREKAAAGSSADIVAITKQVEQRDDEIRGLKAIIHSLSRDGNGDIDKTPTKRRSGHTNGDSVDHSARDKLEHEINEMRGIVEKSLKREEELEKEIESLRRRSASNNRTSAITVGSNGTLTQERTSGRDSRGSNLSWREREKPAQTHRRANTLETMRESDATSTVTEESSLWCEMCETNGHDILSCTSMFGDQAHKPSQSHVHAPPAPHPMDSKPLPAPPRTGRDVVLKALSPKIPMEEDTAKPAPLSPSKKSNHPVTPPPVTIMPNPMDQGPIAGKESRVIDMDKWCALCERDGHESVDCPFEDAF